MRDRYLGTRRSKIKGGDEFRHLPGIGSSREVSYRLEVKPQPQSNYSRVAAEHVLRPVKITSERKDCVHLGYCGG